MSELSPARRALLERLQRGEAPLADRDPVRPRPKDARVPLSVEQEHIWLHAAIASNVPLYNEAVTIHRRGSCDPALLAASFNEVVRRHEIWRTSFIASDGLVVQRVHADLVVPLAFADLTPLPPSVREATARRMATEDATLAFDLSQPPLMRGRIVKFDDADHRLYLTLHHIIFDGVSLYHVLMPTLAAVYAELAAGRDMAHSGPSAMALQYGDYALWRARQAQSADVTRQMAYWATTLAGDLPVLRLPTDHSSPPIAQYRGGMECFAFSAALIARARQASRALGVTLYTLLLAVFETQLFRSSSQTDIIVGGVVDMRRRPALEPLMGYFLNSVPIRTRPTADLSFRAYVHQTSAAVVDALDNCEVPFARLVREVRPRRDPSCHPLFQVLFSIQPPAPRYAEGWDLTQMDVAVGVAKFELYLELEERPEGLMGRFLYRTDLFEPGTIKRMIGHFQTLLVAAIADPDCALGHLDWLTPAETTQLAVWNDTSRTVPATPLHALFEAQVRKKPGAVAVTDGERSCSYAALDLAAERIAFQLRQAGAGPGGVVAVCLDRSIELVAALLGILKTGAAYTPLDPALPRARLAHCLGEAGAVLVLTDTQLREVIPFAEVNVLLLDECAEVINAPPVMAQSDPDSLAYVLCTSGTTGRPKAVEISHGAVVNLLTAMQETPGFGADDVLLAVTTISFDIAGLELFLPLVSGGRVVLASREVAADPVRLAELVDRTGPTVMQATPTTWRALIEHGWGGDPGLRVLVGGEVLLRELADALLLRANEVWNMYGPTETTIWSTIHRVSPGEDRVPIGRPIANTRAYVVDPSGHAVPVGVAGELHLAGAGVARGYRHQPSLTAERFKSAFAAPGQRLYRTGDIVRRRIDGTLEWLGRNDDQVKIRGHRVGLMEIESALEAHPSIAAAAVKTYPDSSGTLGLIAYVVSRENASPDSAALRRYLRQWLPDYMVPAQFVPLAALPTTPNGKRDRAALPKPKPALPAGAETPRSPLEQQLAAIYATVLDRPQIGIEENFFDLGGHSLLAARVLQHVERAFARRLPLSVMFEAPTVAQLGARLHGAPAVPAAAMEAPERKLMMLFESLGDDCEFGLMQRRHGAEPLSLLRFTAINPTSLLVALEHRFEGIADPAALRVTPGGAIGEYIVHNARYDCAYHTFAESGQGPDVIIAREAAKLRIMRPMLIRTLQRGDRICVLKSGVGMTPEQAMSLSAALRRYGPVTLLWVRRADAIHPPGTVRWLGAHVLVGQIDRFAPDGDPQASSCLWLSLCQEACRLWRENQRPAA